MTHADAPVSSARSTHSFASGTAASRSPRIDLTIDSAINASSCAIRFWTLAITEVSHLDATGREQLRVSRLAMNVVGSQLDFSAEPKFRVPKTGKTYFGPVYFRKDSEPYMAIAIPHGKLPGVERVLGVFARSPQGIDFASLDGEPTHLFFVLVAPENAAADHLKALARISRLLKDGSFRRRLMEGQTSRELFKIIAEEDEKF